MAFFISLLCLVINNFTCIHDFLLAQNKSHSPNAKEDPVKGAARCAKWAVRVDQFVKSIRKVLLAPVYERKRAWTEMMNNNEFPLSVVDKLRMERFLDGELVVWNCKGNIMIPTEGKPGYLTCTACESDHHFTKGERVLLHVLGDGHQKKCIAKLDAAEQALRKNLMADHCTAAASNLY